MRNLDKMRGRLTYLAYPVREVSRLHQSVSGKCETDGGLGRGYYDFFHSMTYTEFALHCMIYCCTGINFIEETINELDVLPRHFLTRAK